MKKTYLLLTTAAFAVASCSKTDVSPAAVTPAKNMLAASGKPQPIAPPVTPAAKAGGGGSGSGGSNGGGGNAPVPTNLQIFTQWLTGTWITSIGVADGAPTIVLQIIYKSDGTFSALTTDNSSGAHTSFNGTWQLAIPANLPITANAQLVLISGGKTIMGGLVDFVHPGVLLWFTMTNALPTQINRGEYGFQKN